MLMHTLKLISEGHMPDEIRDAPAACAATRVRHSAQRPDKHPCLDVPASSYTQYLHRHIHTVRSLNSAVEWSFTH